MEDWSPDNNSRKFLYAAILFALIAVGLHSYLSYSYYGVKFGVATGESLCNINQTFNCDVVSASRFSSLFSIPIALFGATTHVALIVFLAILLLGLTEQSKKLARLTLTLSGFIAAMSIVMGSISFTQMGTYCIFCIITYITSFLIFGSLLKALPREFLLNPIDVFQNMRWVAVTLIALPIGGSVLAHNMILDSYNIGEYKEIVRDSLLQWKTGATYEFDKNELLTLGPDDAPVTIVEFADFLCPHCKFASKPLKFFTKNHPEVRLVFKTYPLDGCKGSGIRCSLARAVYCAKKQGKGWETHDWIFERQSEWQSKGISSGIKEMATDIGIDDTALLKCLDEEETKKAINALLEEGKKAKLSGTPTIYIQGRKVRGGQLPPVLDRIVQEAMNQ